MNKHPMLSVKEAANLMGCDERWVRERLNQGQLKGEKKSIGLKDKWFVYAGEVEAALARRAGTANLTSTDYLASKTTPPNTEPINQTTEAETVIVDTEWNDNEDNDVVDGNRDDARLDWLQSQREALIEVAEEMMRPIVLQLEEKNSLLREKEEALQAASYQLGYAKGRMQEQEEKIKLLPDFQARAERAAQLEREAAEAKEHAEDLEKSLAIVTAERVAAEERASEIPMLKQLNFAKDEEARALEEENATLKLQIEDAAQTAQKLAELEKVVQELQKTKPNWFQKLFAPTQG